MSVNNQQYLLKNKKDTSVNTELFNSLKISIL